MYDAPYKSQSFYRVLCFAQTLGEWKWELQLVCIAIVDFLGSAVQECNFNRMAELKSLKPVSQLLATNTDQLWEQFPIEVNRMSWWASLAKKGLLLFAQKLSGQGCKRTQNCEGPHPPLLELLNYLCWSTRSWGVQGVWPSSHGSRLAWRGQYSGLHQVCTAITTLTWCQPCPWLSLSSS